MSESNSPRVAILTSEGYQWNRALVALEQKANNFLKENPHYRFMLGSISHSAGMGGQSTFDNTHYLSLTLIPTEEKGITAETPLVIRGSENLCFLTGSSLLQEQINKFREENPEQAWSLSDVSHVMVPGGTKGGQFHHFRYVVMLLDE